MINLSVINPSALTLSLISSSTSRESYFLRHCPWQWLALRMVLVGMMLIWGIEQTAAAESSPVMIRLQKNSGERHTGSLRSGTASTLTLVDGAEATEIPLADTWQIEVSNAPTARRPRFWLHLNNGDRWGINAPVMMNDELVFEVPFLGEPVQLGLGFVAGLQPLRPGSTWRTDEPEWRQVEIPRIKSDLVILRNGDRPNFEISEIGIRSLTIQAPQGPQTWEWPAVQGIRLDPELAEHLESLTVGYKLLLTNDTWVTASKINCSHVEEVWVTTQVGLEWAIPWTQIRWIGGWGDAAVPLSQLPITHQKHEPRLGVASKVVFDRNTLGLPLHVRSHPADSADLPNPAATKTQGAWPSVSPLGIGMTSGMTVEWSLTGAYQHLICGVVLDETACERGEAEVVWKSDNHPPVTLKVSRSDPPQWQLVDLTGSRTLTIETRFAAQADACDLINLLNPLLIK